MTDVPENAGNEENKLTEQNQIEETKEQEKLEEKVDEKMKDMFDDSTPEPKPEPEPKSTPEPEPEPKPEPDPQKKPEPEPEPEPEPKPADDGTKPEPKPAEDENILTQAEIRAAAHQDISKEHLDELVKANPELAKRTCAKLLEGTNNLSREFAKLGRKVQEASEKPEKEEKPESKIELKPINIDVDKLRKEYGKDDPIVDLVANLQANQQTLVDKVTELGSASVSAAESEANVKAKKAEVAEDAAISQQIDTFFTGSEVAGYKEFYGEVPEGSKDWNKLTGDQVGKRYAVAEQANQILLGAKQQEVEMTIDDAFMRAHLIVTEGIREQVIRDGIKSTSKKREASFTLKPSSSKKTTDFSGKKEGTQFQGDVTQRLKKVFS